MSMGAVKKYIVAWCAERKLPAPVFRRISTERGEALPQDQHTMVASIAGHELRIPVLPDAALATALCTELEPFLTELADKAKDYVPPPKRAITLEKQ